MNYIGVDISKDKLNIAFLKGDAWQKTELYNKLEVIEQWVETLGEDPVQLIFEATGSYGSKLMWVLGQKHKPFTMINPSQSKGFARVQKIQNQTDEYDAILLAQYGAHMKPKASLVASEKYEKLRQTRQTLRQMKKYERMLGNQLHALEQLAWQEQQAKDALLQTLAAVKKSIADLETNLCNLTDDQMKEMAQKITTIKGVGPATARELIIVCNGFKHFDNARQIAKFIGVSPTTKSSGTSVRKKGRISRSGDPGIRGILYMAAISAIRCNHACVELYKRLKDKGKSTKQALVAVAHKLVKQAFAVAKSMKDFDNDYYLKFQRT